MVETKTLQTRRWSRTAIIVLAALAAAQAAWLCWTHVIQPHFARAPLPAAAMDLRGSPLPGLEGLQPGVEAASVPELSGGTVIVAFLISGCAACDDALFALEALAASYGDELGTAAIFGEPAEHMAAHETHLTRLDDPDWFVFERFGVVAVPTILVARDGVVRYQSVGWSEETAHELTAAVARGLPQRNAAAAQ